MIDGPGCIWAAAGRPHKACAAAPGIPQHAWNTDTHQSLTLYHTRSTHGRDIEALTAKAAAAEDAQIRCRDLESAAAALRRELGQAQQENATLARQVALARGEAEEARAEAGKAGRELGSTSDYLAGVMSELAVSEPGVGG